MRRGDAEAGHRHARLQNLILEELRALLRDEVSDPALTDVHVTSVVLSIDYRHARVHFAVPGDPASAEGARVRCERALARATAFLRARLGEALDLKRVPELRFVFDGVTPSGEASS